MNVFNVVKKGFVAVGACVLAAAAYSGITGLLVGACARTCKVSYKAGYVIGAAVAQQVGPNLIKKQQNDVQTDDVSESETKN